MPKFKQALVPAVSLSLAILAFSACNNAGSDKTKGFNDSTMSDAKQIDSLTTTKKSNIEFKFQTLEANAPLPFEIVNDLFTYHAPYTKDLLNPADKADKYISQFKKEVNFGVYGIDLAYINFYGQNAEMLKYYAVVQQLSKDLSMDKVFDTYIDRFKNNSSNKDSIVSIVDNVFAETDAYLKKNDRFLASSHILAGSLIELNYLSLNLLKDLTRTPENAPFFEKVYTENLYIYHLVNLYKEYTDKDSKDLLAALTEYQTSYNAIIKTSADLTPDKIGQVIPLVDKLRNSLVSQ